MSEEKVTVYLHIGAGKTGTSSIQYFLAGNNRILWDSCSCLYPNMGKSNFLNSRFINHIKFFKNHDKKYQIEKIQEAIKFCKKHSKKKMILSDESFLENNKGPALVKELFNIPDIDLKIILYLRRQDSWLESAWKQWGYKSQDYQDISEYIYKRDCNWYTRLHLWDQVIGKEKLIVRCYEKQQLPDGLIPDFLDSTGIDYHSHSWIDRKDLFKGFNRDVMEILFLNKDFCTGIADNRLQGFFEKSLDESFQKDSFKSYSFLSPAEKIFILKKYEETNQEIAREFLNRKDGILFYEEWPSEDEAWEAYQNIPLESLVSTFTRILYNLELNTNSSNDYYDDEDGLLCRINNTIKEKIAEITIATEKRVKKN